MSITNRINVDEFLESRSFQAFHWKVLLLAVAVLFLDGFDVVSIGFIAPAITADWHLTNADLAPILSLGLFGLAIGALLGGPLADKFGRRMIIIVAVTFFGLASLASALSPNVAILSVLRFMTGLGLGAAQPNAATLVSEYAPKKFRSIMVTVTYCGFTFGAAVAGLLASKLVPEYGWASILHVGGIVPLALAAILALMLPESARFLAFKNKGRETLKSIVNTLTPFTSNENTTFFTLERKHLGKSTIAQIVSKPHTLVTLGLWTGLFMNLLTVYFLNSWLPIIIKTRHFSLSDAAMVGALMQTGGTIGNIVIGWELDRFKANRVMVGTLLGAVFFVVCLANINSSLPLLGAMAFMLGYCTNSSNTGWTAMAASYYPTEVRATGTSWMTGIGRFGAISGALVGSVLLSRMWDFSDLFLALTVPIGLALAAALLIARNTSTRPKMLSAVIEP